MPDFRPIIREAYLEILGRAADTGGLEHYNRLMNGGSSEAEVREALLRSPEYAARNPFSPLAPRVGVNVHIPSRAILDDVARSLGLRWIRVDFDWFRIEPEPGRFRWEDTDRVIAGARELGLEVMATLSYTPAWASSNPGAPRVSDPPRSGAFWTDAVRAVVGRYRDRVRFWQFWNEPNLQQFWSGSMGQYRGQILEPAARIAREIRSDVQIVSPGLATLGDWRGWFRSVMQARASIDVINHHIYTSNGRDAIVQLRTDSLFQPSLRTIMREERVDDLPFWLTETGRRTSDGNQRQYYQDVLTTLATETWVERLFFFHYWDGPGQGNSGFGIVNEDFSPKPAYFVLQAALRPSALTA